MKRRQTQLGKQIFYLCWSHNNHLRKKSNDCSAQNNHHRCNRKVSMRTSSHNKKKNVHVMKNNINQTFKIKSIRMSMKILITTSDLIYYIVASINSNNYYNNSSSCYHKMKS